MYPSYSTKPAIYKPPNYTPAYAPTSNFVNMLLTIEQNIKIASPSNKQLAFIPIPTSKQYKFIISRSLLTIKRLLSNPTISNKKSIAKL